MADPAAELIASAVEMNDSNEVFFNLPQGNEDRLSLGIEEGSFEEEEELGNYSIMPDRSSTPNRNVDRYNVSSPVAPMRNFRSDDLSQDSLESNLEEEGYLAIPQSLGRQQNKVENPVPSNVGPIPALDFNEIRGMFSSLVDLQFKMQSDLQQSQTSLKSEIGIKLQQSQSELGSKLTEVKADLQQSQSELGSKLTEVKADLQQSQSDLGSKLEQSQAEIGLKLEQSQLEFHQSQVNLKLEFHQSHVNLKAEVGSKLTEVKTHFQQGQSELNAELVKVQSDMIQQTSDIKRYYLQSLEELKRELRAEILGACASLREEVVVEQQCLSSEVDKLSDKVVGSSKEIRNDLIELAIKSEGNVMELRQEIAGVKKRMTLMELKEGVLPNNDLKAAFDDLKKVKNIKNTKLEVAERSFVEDINNKDDMLPYNNKSSGLAKLLTKDKPIFEGGNPTNFLYNLEGFLRNFGVSNEEAGKNFNIFLKGKALQWWQVTGVKEGESWNELKDRVVAYWFDRAKLKKSWERLTCKPHFDVQRFALQALEIQNSLRKDKNEEKRVLKVSQKLPSPIREFVLMRDPKTIEQFLKDLKQIEAMQNPSDSSATYYYNSSYKNSDNSKNKNNYKGGNNFKGSNSTPTSPKKYLPDSVGYNWDIRGNAYSPDGTCVWVEKGRHPKEVQKGVKYVNAVFVPVGIDPNSQDQSHQIANGQLQPTPPVPPPPLM